MYSLKATIIQSLQGSGSTNTYAPASTIDTTRASPINIMEGRPSPATPKNHNKSKRQSVNNYSVDKPLHMTDLKQPSSPPLMRNHSNTHQSNITSTGSNVYNKEGGMSCGSNIFDSVLTHNEGVPPMASGRVTSGQTATSSNKKALTLSLFEEIDMSVSKNRNKELPSSHA